MLSLDLQALQDLQVLQTQQAPSPFTMILPTTPRPFAPINGLRRKIGPQARILAVFEPRSNTMKLGTMKAQLPWSLEEADLAFCHSGGLDWDAQAALAEMGERAAVGATIDQLVAQVVAAAHAGDHVLCMSNGGFGGIHQKLTNALQSDPVSSSSS